MRDAGPMLKTEEGSGRLVFTESFTDGTRREVALHFELNWRNQVGSRFGSGTGSGMSLYALRFQVMSAGLLLVVNSNLVAQTNVHHSNHRRAEVTPATSIGLAKAIIASDDPIGAPPVQSEFAVPNPQRREGQSGVGTQSIVLEASGGPLTDSLAPLQSRDLTLRVQAVSISNESIGTGLLPEPSRPAWPDETLELDRIGRGEIFTNVFWQPSLIQHHPLYFEDAMLERHGHTRCCLGLECTQSLVSGAKFFGTIAFLPYLRTLQPKHQCVYSLGHYRAGSGAPCLRSNLPYDKHAAIVESASAAAFFWATPL
jgi:hypothetical protein